MSQITRHLALVSSASFSACALCALMNLCTLVLALSPCCKWRMIISGAMARKSCHTFSARISLIGMTYASVEGLHCHSETKMYALLRSHFFWLFQPPPLPLPGLPPLPLPGLPFGVTCIADA